MPAWKFTNKTLSHILSVFYLHFLRIHHFYFSHQFTITSSEEGLKVCEYNFFQRKVVLLVIYLFNHDSSKSTVFMMNIAYDVPLSAVFVK